MANRAAREHLVEEAIERAVIDSALPFIHVDDTRDLDSVTDAVEQHFAPVLARLPRAESVEARSALRRAENRTVLEQIRLYLEASPSAGTLETASFDYACECGRSGCRAVVELTAAEYARTPSLVHPDHAR